MARRDGYDRRLRAWPPIVLNRRLREALSRVTRDERPQRS